MDKDFENIRKKFSFLTRISEGASELLRQSVMVHRTGEKETLISRGDAVNGVYLVINGTLRVYTISARGRESTLYLISPGESCILALNCVFSDVLYPAWVETDGHSAEIAVIPGDIYKRIYNSEKAVSDFTMNVLSARIFNLMSVIEEFATLPVGHRIASFILKNTSRSGELQISHERLAVHTGTAREVVTRNLKKLQQKKLIKSERGCIILTDRNGLLDYLNSEDEE